MCTVHTYYTVYIHTVYIIYSTCHARVIEIHTCFYIKYVNRLFLIYTHIDGGDEFDKNPFKNTGW